jgi:CRP-like cAMP-binding protein
MTTTISLFRNSMDTIEYLAGQVIFKKGDAAHALYVVTEGEVGISIGDEVMEVVGAGGMFGELALIDPSPRSATATALTNVKIVPVNEKRFIYLVQQTPGFSLHVMKVLAERLKKHDPKKT